MSSTSANDWSDTHNKSREDSPWQVDGYSFQTERIFPSREQS